MLSQLPAHINTASESALQSVMDSCPAHSGAPEPSSAREVASAIIGSPDSGGERRDLFARCPAISKDLQYAFTHADLLPHWLPPPRVHAAGAPSPMLSVCNLCACDRDAPNVQHCTCHAAASVGQVVALCTTPSGLAVVRQLHVRACMRVRACVHCGAPASESAARLDASARTPDCCRMQQAGCWPASWSKAAPRIGGLRSLQHEMAFRSIVSLSASKVAARRCSSSAPPLALSSAVMRQTAGKTGVQCMANQAGKCSCSRCGPRWSCGRAVAAARTCSTAAAAVRCAAPLLPPCSCPLWPRALPLSHFTAPLWRSQ